MQIFPQQYLSPEEFEYKMMQILFNMLSKIIVKTTYKTLIFSRISICTALLGVKFQVKQTGMIVMDLHS